MDRDKRECILLSAAKAFARFGFKKASVEDIAREAGVAKGTVYLACDSKQDLFYQVLHRELREWLAQGARLIEPRRPADALLPEVTGADLDGLSSRELVRDLLTGRLHALVPAWAARFDELRVLGRGNVSEVLRLGARQGVFRDDVDLDRIAAVVQDLQVATLLFPEAAPSPDAPPRWRAGLELVLDGLRARAA